MTEDAKQNENAPDNNKIAQEIQELATSVEAAVLPILRALLPPGTPSIMTFAVGGDLQKIVVMSGIHPIDQTVLLNAAAFNVSLRVREEVNGFVASMANVVPEHTNEQ